MPDPAETWINAVVDRHTRALSPAEFLKAVRALSVRYVERRAELTHRSPTDSAGKRAAFAGFFAPLHFLTARAIVSSIGAADRDIRTILDLGCGTGAASAAWALPFRSRPEILGVDRQGWALDEAVWNWRALGLRGRTRRGDLVRAVSDLSTSARRTGRGTAVLLAWSLNELDDGDRRPLWPALVALPAAGVSVLVIEPLARAAVPWWDEWASAAGTAGGRADEWKIDLALPPILERLREAAGFRRQSFGARSLWLPGRENSRATIEYGPTDHTSGRRSRDGGRPPGR